ncbi:hypothetical protein STEG23_028342 [Scotinomys teguina]
MEAASSQGTLQKLRERLCTETEPKQLYKTLKKLSSLPNLCDTLAEINFKQTIKLLRKQNLLVPFAKDLAIQWSEGSQSGPQTESAPGDFAYEVSLRTEPPRNCPEEKPCESMSRGHRQDGPEVLQVSGSSDRSGSSCKHSSLDASQSLRQSPSPKWNLSPRPSRQSQSPNLRPSSSPRPRARLSTRTSLDLRGPRSPRLEARESKWLAARSQVPGAKPRASAEEPWRLQVAKPISSKSDAGGKTPAHWIQERPLAASLEACLNSDSSAPSSALPGGRVPLTRCKRSGESTWKAEALSSGAKVSRGQSESCHHWDENGVAGSLLPEEAPDLRAASPLGDQEHASSHINQEAPLWACRKNSRTPVYSGHPAWFPHSQPSKLGHLPEPNCPWQTHCPDPAVAAAEAAAAEAEAVEETEPWRQEEESRSPPNTDKPTRTQTESITILQLQESQELRLQALRARIQGTLAKKPPGRQTEMIVFPTRVTSPGQQPESGHGGAASSSSETHSLQEASAHGQPRRPPCLLSKSSNKSQPKRPAPLMAKARRDYKKRLSQR